eukprot:m.66133 g.66133  ORF g.66133 m.66133 type:complete len:216 (+) comp12102_c0_seq3:97-744(+)
MFGKKKQKKKGVTSAHNLNWCDNPLHSDSEEEDEIRHQSLSTRPLPVVPQPSRPPLPLPSQSVTTTPAPYSQHSKTASAPMLSPQAPPALPSRASDRATSIHHPLPSAVSIPSFHARDWFHGAISRHEAEKRLQQGGMVDGLFLVRTSSKGINTFALSVCHKGQLYHNTIEKQPHNTYLYVGVGREFETLEDLVNYYLASTASKLALSQVCTRPQ